MNANQNLWQVQYIETFLGNKVENGLIMNRDGTLWAASPNFNLATSKGMVVQEDGSEVEKEINEEENLVEFAKTGAKPKNGGFRMNGIKYQMIRKSEDEKTVYLKCTNGGATLSLTNKAIVLGTWNEKSGVPKNSCDTQVEALAAHLRQHAL